MKLYSFYTKPIEEMYTVMSESVEETEDIELIGILHENNTDGLAGSTGSGEYMQLMLARWQNLPRIIEDNIGDNIMFVDCDIVFNKKKKNFVKNINSFLEDLDVVTQYDTNTGMSARINMGFLAIKCNEKTLNFFSKYVELISNIKKPQQGFPQIEFNNYIQNQPEESRVAYKTLPKEYGYKDNIKDCYFYHAISIGNLPGKIAAMNIALNNFTD